MNYDTLISTGELSRHLRDPDWAIVDCRFSLQAPDSGRQKYMHAHIPGAVYAHLNLDLSGEIVPGVTGRHPLPEVDKLIERFSAWGISAGVQVVAYDDNPAGAGGIAARLWWLLQWLGHEAVAVLNGGWNAWVEAGLSVAAGEEFRSRSRFVPRRRPELFADSADVQIARSSATQKVFDSRSSERYRGENEPIDSVAGHIPGAVSAPYMHNIGEHGLFLPPDQLAQRFQSLLGDTSSKDVIFYCGSGVTAAHNLLAMKHAGLGDGRLYVGSWSEWITDPDRPIAIE